MGIFISVSKTVECVLTAVIFAALLCADSYKVTGILQSCGYSGKKLFGWAKKKGNMILTRHTLLAMLCVLSCATISLCFSFAGDWAAIVGLSAYVIFLILYAVADNKAALKCPATPTPRFKRLYAVMALTAAVLVYFTVTLLNFADYLWGNRIFNILRYCALSVYPLLILPIVALSNLVSKIYELPHNGRLINKAKKKLAESRLTVIGITGSYGKTSVKHILTEILSAKYRVLATPRSYNTPIGVALTVNGARLEDYDLFIAEMGARHVGDIAALCEICPPDYSVITGICPQHLESFKSIENVIKAKGEILEATKNQAVIAEDAYDLFAAYSCTKQRATCLSDVESGPFGTRFKLTLGGKSFKVKCKLLGRHSAENVALAATLAYSLGVDAESIVRAIENIGYIEHRLQLIQTDGVNILDDGYNSNVKGAAAALEVLKSFGGRKIVITPGLVELGILEESENTELGKRLVGLDLVILVGDTLITPVKQGYLKNGGDTQKLIVKPTLDEAQKALTEYIAAGDTVLFLNDLPDIYL